MTTRPKTLKDYEHGTLNTAIYPRLGHTRLPTGVVYTAMGLAGEAGETLNSLKKVIRDDDGEISAEKAASLANELGDVLYYVVRLANELGFSFEHIAQLNASKLENRKQNGTLRGGGDSR